MKFEFKEPIDKLMQANHYMVLCDSEKNNETKYITAVSMVHLGLLPAVNKCMAIATSKY